LEKKKKGGGNSRGVVVSLVIGCPEKRKRVRKVFGLWGPREKVPYKKGELKRGGDVASTLKKKTLQKRNPEEKTDVGKESTNTCGSEKGSFTQQNLQL